MPATKPARLPNWAELQAKALREQAFNHGFDAALRKYMSPQILVAFDFTNATYQQGRKQAFEESENVLDQAGERS